MVMPSSKKKKKKNINFHFILNDKMVAWRMGNVREKYSLCYISLIFFFYNVFRKVPLWLYYYNKILQHFSQ